MPAIVPCENLPAADSQRGNVTELVWWLLGGYAVLILLCAVWLRAPGVMAEGQTLNYDRAFFLSVSAATLTGFQQTIGPNDFNGMQGALILILLTVAGSLMVMILGALAAARVLQLPFSDQQIIVAALTVELLVMLAGTAVLYTAHTDMVDAVLQTACAFGNSGAVITAKTAGLLGPKNRFPAYDTWQAQCVLLPLAVLGGLGLPVIMDVYGRMMGGARPISFHSRTVIKLTAGVYLAATLLLFAGALAHHHAHADVSASRKAFVAASTTALNARSAGLPFDVLDVFSRPCQWLIVALMMVGASPAGTAGGIKCTTFWHLFIGVRNILQGKPVNRVVGIAAVWLGVYGVMAALGFLLLAAVASQMATDQAAFLTISALSNVGLSHDPVSTTGGGLFALAGIMLAGRLAPLAILCWMAKTTRGAEVLVA